MKLTKTRLDNAECKGNKAEYLWDGSLTGFGVKLLPSGGKNVNGGAILCHGSVDIVLSRAA